MGLYIAVSHGSVEEIGLAVLDEGRTGEAAAGALIGLVGGQAHGLFFPMDQVITGNVGPIKRGCPHSGVGVMLEKGMVLSVEIAEAIGVVQPALFRLYMILQLG